MVQDWYRIGTGENYAKKFYFFTLVCFIILTDKIPIFSVIEMMSLGVSKKGRRKLTYNEKQYVWYVQEDNDSPYYCLNIISDDKQLILTLPVGSDIKYVICKGKRFQTNKSNGCWERYVCPLELPEIITPKIVADVINWAEYGNEAVVFEYNGKEFTV